MIYNSFKTGIPVLKIITYMCVSKLLTLILIDNFLNEVH